MLKINDTEYDFSTLPDGATIPAGETGNPFIVGPIDRVGSEIHLTLILPIPAKPSHAQAFPEPLTITTNGAVALPEGPQDVEA